MKKREAGKLGNLEAQKLKAESMEQKASEGGTGNAEMKRKRHGAECIGIGGKAWSRKGNVEVG